MPTTLTQLDLVNNALAKIAVTTRLTVFPQTETEEGIQISLAYARCRDYVLRQRNWAFATEYATLATPVIGADTAEDWQNRWQFAYELPADLIRLRRFITARGDRDPEPPPFVIGQIDDVLHVFTNVSEEFAQVEYTKRAEDFALYPDDFCEVLEWRLAYSLSFPLSADEELRKTALQMYGIELRTAGATQEHETRRGRKPRGKTARGRFGGTDWGVDCPPLG